MVRIPLATPAPSLLPQPLLRSLLAAANVHAVASDGPLLWTAPARLWPYAVALLAVPPAVPSVAGSYLVTLLFLIASWAHFGRDVGRRASAAMHAWWVSTPVLGCAPLGWATFAAYYCGLHAPWRLHAAVLDAVAGSYAAPADDSRVLLRVLLRLLLLLYVGSFVLLYVGMPATLSDRMQSIVVAHVLVDELAERQR